MADTDKAELLKSIRQRKYLNKSFDPFRADLLEYARTYYGDKIKDFSENSIGGLFLDFAAYVGDTMSFYMDHQFTELDPLEAVETVNIQRHLLNSGVKITGASPAVTGCTFFIEVPVERVNGVDRPRVDVLPIIKQGTIVSAENGIQFELTEDLNFAKLTPDGDALFANQSIGDVNAAGIPQTYILSMTGLCVSGFFARDQFSIDDEFVPFRTVTLSNSNVTQIVNVIDSSGNIYYEVEDLSEDVTFVGITNKSSDGDLVQENLEVIPIPYRFKADVDLSQRSTTLVFGGGEATSLEDDVLPDPSEFALPLYGKRTFPITSLNPSTLLKTRTLGISPLNTTITVDYRYGGGLDHNVSAKAISEVSTLVMEFPGNPSISNASKVRSSVDVINYARASGGEDSPSILELRDQIPAARNSQSRVVTKQDLLARVYTMPSNFGRVFRAGVRPNPNNPLATQLYVISRDKSSRLIPSPDTLKDNLATYLNQFRMISDAVDILDVNVVNLKLSFEISADPSGNKQLILQNILKKLKKYFDIKNFQVEQPIIISDLVTLIFSVPGVISINPGPNGSMVRFTNVSGINANKEYSDIIFDIASNTTKGMIIPPNGGIFEIRYPDIDIVGTAI